MMLFVTLAVFVAAKFLSARAIGHSLGRWVSDPWEAGLAGWLALQAALVAGILTLSAATLLTPTSYLVLVGMILIVALFAGRRARSLPPPPGGDESRLPALFTALGLVLLGLLLVHAWYFYDTTDDAANFLLPRIALWYQNHTVLLRLPDRYFEISAWEWNSDFNVLGYFLATGRDQACAFASVESWVVLLGAVAVFVRQLGGSVATARMSAVLVGSAPITFLLAQTVKGELSALAGLLLGLTWLLQALRTAASPVPAVLALAALTFAAGCKITVLPLAGLLGLLAFVRLLAAPGARIAAGALAVALAGLFSFRHLVNLALYGKLLDRVSNQPRGMSLANLVDNARGVGSHLFARGLDLQQYYPLFSGVGLLAVVSLVVGACHGDRLAAFGRQWRGQVADTNSWLLAGCFLGSALFFAASLPWYSWSFRYYLPWLLPLVLLPFAAAFPVERQVAGFGRPALVAGLGFVVLLHLAAVTRPSEVTPGSSLGAALRWAASSDPLDRKLGDRADLAEPFRANLAPEPGRDSVRVAALASTASVHYPLFGQDALNPVTFVGNFAELLAQCRQGQPEVAVISQHLTPSPAELAALRAAGYHSTGRIRDLLFFRRNSPAAASL